eukprot:Seg353.6 transcript_id=Seg353.6/GoldUCD/mRNA.D3Y31 product="Arginine-hydroxylase NDUFAF5 mitochondrial" protein_id=Seg353.6/GoldUCD/D3Y31
MVSENYLKLNGDKCHLLIFGIKCKDSVVTIGGGLIRIDLRSLKERIVIRFLHWVNDLPGVLRKVKSCLKEDGMFLAAMIGGETLFELRTALQLAELEQEGGFAPHISPFAQMSDCGNLLTRAGFNLTTVDFDEITVDYPSIQDLMKDLKGMGENNAARNRKSVLHRRTVEAASRIYKEYYGNPDGSIPATFQILYMIGWKPSVKQAKPMERGSADVSLKDLGNMIEDLPKGPPR